MTIVAITYFLMTVSVSVSIGWFVGRFFKEIKVEKEDNKTYVSIEDYENTEYKDYSTIVQTIVMISISVIMTIIGLYLKIYYY